MATDRKQAEHVAVTWEEESGLLGFLSTINEEVKRFDETFDLGVEMLPGQPQAVDARKHLLQRIGFVVLRRNSALINRDYCLYSVLQGKTLRGFIGVYAKGSITTRKELGQITDFRKAQASLLNWLRDLVKASCDKI